MRIVCQQTILMKYHALFVILEKVAKFLFVVCCILYVALYELMFLQIPSVDFGTYHMASTSLCA